MNKYGISKKDFYKIINIFKEYSSIIEKVIIFGSRARGDYRDNSDIDLTIKFRKNNGKINSIIEKIEEKIIYTVDIIDYDHIHNMKLKEYIDTEGKVIFLIGEEGELLMNKNKLIDKFNDLKRAHKKLEECIKRDYKEDDIVLDATIQRFEFTYELSWKLMKGYLEYNGNADINGPRKAIKESFKMGILKDGNSWLDIIQDRNRTSHTYDEESAVDIFENIKDRYVHVIKDYLKTMENELKDII
ncbi:MAG: HI0074 family nucleotidyltransferase substrate-binding subunit [Anaeromicrobium sp.]|jgi:nucleotidyltransferase substrate binding protein (TIGR01987 family)|uniref:HI0074 family nucleotidyltransferase substrate-binding subunit n=1 Tax=Anaeromicrobium sp. TaxID=1929132 RepID=UPI0025E4F1AC|nr:HI0074 family nucleotidyltransferase substrate-binding subunit [Anaeromicrobium sp.]MCT4594240.1 HI0074 family nucleotidyltransferase substrate-binding subunit [Anaeromicrobium sp.]